MRRTKSNRSFKHQEDKSGASAGWDALNRAAKYKQCFQMKGSYQSDIRFPLDQRRGYKQWLLTIGRINIPKKPYFP